MRRLAVIATLAALMAVGSAMSQPCGRRTLPPCLLQANPGEIVLAQADPDSVAAGDTASPDWSGFPGPATGERHLDQLRLLKLLELLELSEDQEVSFVTMFHRVQKDTRQIEDEKRALVTQLADKLGSGDTDENAIMQLVEQIHQKDRDRVERMDQFLREAQHILTPTQLGKLVIFHERFEAEMLKRLRAFHDRGGPMGPGRRGGR